VKRDLSIMLKAAVDHSIPLVIGSCGGAGANVHLAGFSSLIREIASELELHFRLATISAEQPQATILGKLHEGKVHPLGPVPALTADEVGESTRIVAMMGVEPIIEALKNGANVVLAGRIADPAIFAAVPLLRGVDKGLAWHTGKSIDKGGLATDAPSEGSPVLACIGEDGFTVEPCKPTVHCTVSTVAALTLHENPNPFRITEPGGTLDTSNASYEQLDDGRVLVRNAEFTVEPYTVKLEGAALDGYRSLLIAGIRDPRVIEQFDEFLEKYRVLVGRVTQSMGISPDQYVINFRCYGKDAVLGQRELVGGELPREIGLIVDVVADSEELARAICSRVGPVGSRLDVSGRSGGGGNFAYPFSPSVIYVGPVYRWSVWHTMDVDIEELPQLFPITYEEV
jgi:hypothetical protein